MDASLREIEYAFDSLKGRLHAWRRATITALAAVNSRLYHLRRFYYDTAISASPIFDRNNILRLLPNITR